MIIVPRGASRVFRSEHTLNCYSEDDCVDWCQLTVFVDNRTKSTHIALLLAFLLFLRRTDYIFLSQSS